MQVTDEQINSASSLCEVASLVGGCQRCELYRTKTNDVSGEGSPSAEIFFIGEAPGKKEDLMGEPFVGPSGKLLEVMLASIGLNRNDVFITSVLKHRPPNNRDPLTTEAEACWPYLKRQIELINPKLIVFLGRHATIRFFPKLKISEVHGQVFEQELWGRKHSFLALYHPAAALYNGSMKQTLADDFKNITKILKQISERSEGELQN